MKEIILNIVYFRERHEKRIKNYIKNTLRFFSSLYYTFFLMKKHHLRILTLLTFFKTMSEMFMIQGDLPSKETTSEYYFFFFYKISFFKDSYKG